MSKPRKGDHVYADGKEWRVIKCVTRPTLRDGVEREYVELNLVMRDGRIGESVHLYRLDSITRKDEQ